MDKVNKLKTIWDSIPKAVTQQIDLSQKEIIRQYMEMFHFGDYFYLIFNTQAAQMEYIDAAIEKVLGYTADEFDLPALVEMVHPDDLPYYYHYEQSAVRFFTGLTPELFFKYKFSYDYRIKQKDLSYKRVLQQVMPVYYFPDGGARTLCIFTDLTHLNLHGIPKLSFIGMQGAPSYYNVHLEESFRMYEPVFTKKEFEILRYMAQGLKSEEIAKNMNRSIFTVRSHRKNILKKSGCTNISELLIKSIREGWM